MTFAVQDALSVNPIQPGRWWLSVPRGQATASWIDALAASAHDQWPGRVAVLDSSATLISNLQVWENLILPVWHRENNPLNALEERVVMACELAGMTDAQREKFVTCLPAMLDRGGRRLAVLLRSVLIDPDCVIVEDEFWRDMTSQAADAPQVRLFHCLQEIPCFVVVGRLPKSSGFVSVDVVE